MLVSRSGTNCPGGSGGSSICGASSRGTASSEASPRIVIPRVVVVSKLEVVVVDVSTTVLVGSATRMVAIGTPVLVAPAATTGSGVAVGFTGAIGATGATEFGAAVGFGVCVASGKGAVATGVVELGETVAGGRVARGTAVLATAARGSGLFCATEVRAVATQLENTTPRAKAVATALWERVVMGIETLEGAVGLAPNTARA